MAPGERRPPLSGTTLTGWEDRGGIVSRRRSALGAGAAEDSTWSAVSLQALVGVHLWDWAAFRPDREQESETPSVRSHTRECVVVDPVGVAA